MYAILDQLDSKINKCINIKCKFNGYFIVISWRFHRNLMDFSWHCSVSIFMVSSWILLFHGNFMTFSYTGDTMNFKKVP